MMVLSIFLIVVTVSNCTLWICTVYVNYNKMVLRIKSFQFQEFPLWLSELRTQHSVHEDAGLIPGLAPWVKEPMLPQAVALSHGCVSDPVWLWLCVG